MKRKGERDGIDHLRQSLRAIDDLVVEAVERVAAGQKEAEAVLRLCEQTRAGLLRKGWVVLPGPAARRAKAGRAAARRAGLWSAADVDEALKRLEERLARVSREIHRR